MSIKHINDKGCVKNKTKTFRCLFLTRYLAGAYKLFMLWLWWRSASLIIACFFCYLFHSPFVISSYLHKHTPITSFSVSFAGQVVKQGWDCLMSWASSVFWSPPPSSQHQWDVPGVSPLGLAHALQLQKGMTPSIIHFHMPIFKYVSFFLIHTVYFWESSKEISSLPSGLLC